MKTKVPSVERRFNPGKVELRAEEGKPPLIRGYAAMFNTRSENLGGFVEIIARGAFDDVLSNDVRALVNHDPNLILGRTASGTCRIGVDEKGLWYEITPAETQASRDLMISLKRGDIDQSSFAFSIQRDGQKWEDDTTGQTLVRTVTKVARLFDVSCVTFPAYPDTQALARTLDDAREAGLIATPPPNDTEQRGRALALAEAEA